MRSTFGLLICGLAVSLLASSHAANPLITSTYTADPSPHKWSDGKYYMYCSHDQDADVDWNMVDYHVFSSTDLVNWTDNGIAFRNTDSPFLSSGWLWAPDCAEKNGKFYLYYPQKSVIGVATSTSPTGYFTNAKLLYSGPANCQWVYDPMVFTDDDGQTYLISSACMQSGEFKPVLIKLGADMTSFTEETILSTTGDFHEGPWMFKRNGLYYLVWGGGNCDYATSTNIKGPYTYKGSICTQWRDANGNLIKGQQQHPGIANFSGQWYFASAWGAPDNKRRQVFMDYLNFNDDGTIRFVAPTMEGVVAPGQTRTLSAFRQIAVANYTQQSGTQLESCSDTSGGVDAGWIENGDYLMFSKVNFGSGANGFDARVASANSGGSIEIRLDSLTSSPIGTCTVTGTGGWQTWITKSCPVQTVGGTHDVYLKFIGNSGTLLNLNWFRFSGSGSQPQNNSTYHIIFNQSGKAMDNGGSTTDGGQVNQWADQSGNVNQEWKLVDVGSGYYSLICQKSGKALDNSGSTTDGTIMKQWTLQPGNQNQHWQFTTDGAFYKLISRVGGKALDNGGSTTDGTAIKQWTPQAGNANQQVWLEFIR